MPQKATDESAFLVEGCDSMNDPGFLKKTQFVWGWNGIHRGGRFRTRPGYSELIEPPVLGEQTDALNPQGLTIFKPLNDTWYVVMAHAGIIYKSRLLYNEPFTPIAGLQFYAFAEQILFEPRCIRQQYTDANGNIVFLDQPYPVLLIQDGFTRAGYWDGSMAAHTNKIAIGQAMIWNSNRLWIGDGHKLHAGDFGNPLDSAEEKITATGGFFVMTTGQDITAIAETPDLQALLAFTDDSCDTFQSAITDRTQWETTPGFQKQLFRNIGCVGPKAWANQYGITWWMSHNGVIGLDTALQTYRTRRVKYADKAVARSKSKLHKNLRRVCAGQYENFLFFSWPSADRFNSHTVVMDELSFSGAEQNSPLSTWAGAWKGTRPVEWVTCSIDGETRCIALSRDYASTTGSNYQIGIWEAFCRQRADVLLDGTVKRISCGIELRQMAMSKEPKKLTSVKAFVSELRNQIDGTLSFNGRMSAFTQISSFHIDASQFNPDQTDFNEYRPQNRVIRSEESVIASSTYVTAQGKYQQAVDYGFGVLLTWQGELCLDLACVYCVEQPEAQIGDLDINETDARLVGWDGIEQITNEPPATVYAQPRQSVFIDSITERYIEPAYSSR
jgi:hypothetical protein